MLNKYNTMIEISKRRTSHRRPENLHFCFDKGDSVHMIRGQVGRLEKSGRGGRGRDLACNI